MTTKKIYLSYHVNRLETKLKESEDKNMSLMSKLQKNSKVKGSDIMSDSKVFKNNLTIKTEVPMLNVALGGSLDGGLCGGLLTLAGPSKHFKTNFALKLASEYLASDPEAIMLFYDTEFGSPQGYFDTFDIDMSRVFHSPIMNLEEMKFDLISQLEGIEKKDKVVIVIDSIGNSASKKEVDDAIDEKSVADMTRAKAIKGLFRMITPYLKLKDIPCLVINHTYKEQGLYPKDIVSGGTGIMYSSDNVWIVGRRQQKTGKDITGYEFIIKVEKSRFVKEGSKIPITVTFEGGIEKYSGLLDLAMVGGFVVKPTNGWYQKVDLETGEVIDGKYREKETLTADFWDDYLDSKKFQKFVEDVYKLGQTDVSVDVVPDEEIVGA